MTDHGELCPAATTIAGAAVQSKCCRKPIKSNRHWLKQVRMDSTEARKLLLSGNPNVSVGERIMSRHDRFDDIPAGSSQAAPNAIETARRWAISG